MQYQEFAPSENLQEIVQNYWCFHVYEDDGMQFPLKHETLPDSSVSIVLIEQPYFQGVRLLGQHTRKFQQTIFPNSRYLGIRLLPWLTFRPQMFNKKEILNKTAEAPDFVAQLFNSIIQSPGELNKSALQMLESNLLALIKGMEVVQHEAIKYICLELSRGKTIATVIKELPFSIRVIQKKFKEIVGVTMQQFASTARQRKLWEDMLKGDKEKGDLIFEHHFYDQAHFINDFKKKMHRSHIDFESYLHKIDIQLN